MAFWRVPHRPVDRLRNHSDTATHLKSDQGCRKRAGGEGPPAMRSVGDGADETRASETNLHPANHPDSSLPRRLRVQFSSRFIIHTPVCRPSFVVSRELAWVSHEPRVAASDLCDNVKPLTSAIRRPTCCCTRGLRSPRRRNGDRGQVSYDVPTS